MKYSIIFVMAMLLVACVGAVPTTGAATNVTNGAVMFHATGSGTTGFFKWGATNGSSYKWVTPNQSYTTSFQDYWIGSPLMVNKTYYVVACDNTGCGSQVSFTTGTANITNATSYGTGFTTLLKSGFNATALMSAIGRPYTSSMPGGAPVTYGLLFFFIFAGYWLRHKDVTIPAFLAMISGGAIWLGSSSLGVPPEFQMVGQGLLYAAIAGLAVSWFSK